MEEERRANAGKPSWGKRIKTFWTDRNTMQLRGPNTPYEPKRDWKSIAEDCEQNRLNTMLVRQVSFEHRWKAAEYVIQAENRKTALRAERHRRKHDMQWAK